MRKQEQILTEYKEFCAAEGNQHIASEYAVIKLQDIIDSFGVENILEIGLGIGAIAGSLLPVNEHLKYAGTEDNEFCLDALKTNLGEKYRKVEVFSELSEVPQIKFDLIIIDGKDPDLAKIQQLVTQHGIIAIEGDRIPQQEMLRKYFPGQKYVHSISIKKNAAYSPFPQGQWKGGLKIIFVNPNLHQTIWWLREKVFTKLKYLYRKLR
ncbi:class I SAM-dependent methyltransferase [Salegentibacter sp. LM13S]|uniref:class I SAM-dependent methyltransferase n=1 Tax=Salegentibacter lacus TaxID=2873599 RepID=UPI001CCDEBBF|nr:class I SAM-dependent methyltransferase [Salegentibacter lacus]MBZ9632365.1 class I SAM-dependent methyltransferase [Salegentibacter lacus]